MRSSEEALDLADTEEHAPPCFEDDAPTTEECAPPAFAKKPSRARRWLKRIVLLFLLLGLLGVGTIVGIFWHQGRDLPNLNSVSLYKPWRITRVMDIHQNIVMELATQRRKVLSYQKLPPHLIQAMIAAEDGDFFNHHGFDYFGMMRAFWRNLWRRKGAPKQGGSTITQQVVKTFLLTREQTYTRKIKEAILAWRMERHLRKWEILYLYLNQIDFGRGNFGVEAASQYYFGKSALALKVHESAILAGIPKNPERYNPANSIPLTRRRRNYVLRMMRRLRFLDKAAYKRLLTTKIATPPLRKRPPFQRDYYTEAVRQEALRRIATYLQQKRGMKPGKKLRAAARRLLYRGGLRIDTALEPRAQRLATKAMRQGLRTIDRRHGYRGPIGYLPREEWPKFMRKPYKPDPFLEALVLGQDARGYVIAVNKHKGRLPWAGMRWLKHSHTRKGSPSKRLLTLLRPGALIWVSPLAPGKRANAANALRKYQLEQIPKVQGALVVIDPRGHQVRALVGGWGLNTHPYNRAILARRQPGSAFKPIVFAAAIDSKKYTAASVFQDSPLTMYVDGKPWQPTNYTNTYSNQMVRMREALIGSINTVAIRLFDGITAYRAIGMARRLGIRTPLTLKPSLALGASAVQPLALTNAYATFAARGAYDEPVLLTRILTHNGQLIYEKLPAPKRVVSPEVAHIVTSMLEDVVQKGTGRAARSLRRPIAGKTGTTNGARNAWFVGYTPTVCTGVYIGHDDNAPLGKGESGGRTALPIFVDWMKQYHTKPDGSVQRVRDFVVPEGLVTADIDPSTGYLAPPHQTDAIKEFFLPGTQPTQYARNLGPVADPKQFYKMQE